MERSAGRRASGPRATASRRVQPHSFRVLLAPLLALYAVTSLPGLLPLEGVVGRLALLAVLVASLYALSGDRRALQVGAGFAVAAIGLDALSGALPGRAFWLAELALVVVFSVGMLAVVLREILVREAMGDADALLGAVCGYLLLVLIFSRLSLLIETASPGAFHLGGDTLPAGMPQQMALLQYFGTVTLTTLGYGDVVPVSSPARLLAGTGALSGHLYVAIIVAALVGSSRRRLPCGAPAAPRTPPDGAPGADAHGPSRSASSASGP